MKTNKICLILSALIATNAHIQNSYSSLRIYNGVDVVTSQFPYVVCLKANNDIASFVLRICTGSLITQVWVLTASHCLLNIVEYIQYGNMSIPLLFTQSKSKVYKMIKHPRYVEPMTVNDIGLLLVSPVFVAKYARLSAVDYKTLHGRAVVYAGYGQTFFYEDNTKSRIFEFMLDVFRPLQVGEGVLKNCDDDLLPENLLCVASKCSRKQTVLPGDSGGPMFLDGKIIAVACAVITDYSAQSFTPISPHLTWIQKVILPDVN